MFTLSITGMIQLVVDIDIVVLVFILHSVAHD